ncbi:hypothetical protein CX680_31410, partial [Klebsiella pneumoniae]
LQSLHQAELIFRAGCGRKISKLLRGYAQLRVVHHLLQSLHQAELIFRAGCGRKISKLLRGYAQLRVVH